MKVPSIISKIFTNKYFLYLMVFLSFTNVIGYIILGNIHAVIYFIIISLVIAFFSKNMSLILFIALIFTNIIIVNKFSSKEGLENNKTETITNTKNNLSDSQQLSEKKSKTSVNNETPPIVPIQPVPEPTEQFTGGKKLSGSKVDYASTIENAYDNLNKLLGSEGMKNLTNDTQRLIHQQKGLAESMKSMGPLIENIAPLLNQTKDMLGSMNMGNIDQIASMIGNMTSK